MKGFQFKSFEKMEISGKDHGGHQNLLMGTFERTKQLLKDSRITERVSRGLGRHIHETIDLDQLNLLKSTHDHTETNKT